MTDTCTNCRFSQVLESTTFCCFDPPEFVPPNGTILKPVRAEGWCGKHEKEQTRKVATKNVPAPVSDPNRVLFADPALPDKSKNRGKSRL